MLLSVLFGCTSHHGSDDTAGPGDSGATDPTGLCGNGPTVVLGNGDAAHVPVADGDVVTMVHGPQGGWHIWYSFRAYDFADLVSYQVTGDDLDLGIRIIDGHASVALVPAEPDCAGDVYGIFGFLPGDDPETAEDETPPVYLAGHSVRMSVDVEDLDDASVTAHDEVVVTTTCDPADVGVYAGC
jgi:hypothetical protein